MSILIQFLQLIFRLIFRLPANLALSFMHGASWLLQAMAKKTGFKTTVANNVKSVLPQSNATQISEKLIKNTAYSIFEVLCHPFFKKEHYQSICKLEGAENIAFALKEGRGVILLTMHAGNYEITPQVLALKGFKLNSVLRGTEDPMFKIVNRSRAVGGVNLINVLEQDMYRETLKALAQNQCVYLLADTGALESRHESIKFLGKAVPVATGWLTLAQRSEAPVIPVLSKKKGAKNTIYVYEPIKVTKDNREQALQQAGSVFENFIGENPEQWAMFLNSYETKRMVEGK